MFKIFKSLFVSKDDKALSQAEADFDELMKEVEKDEEDLAKLEKHVHKEFADMEKDLEKMDHKADELMKV